MNLKEKVPTRKSTALSEALSILSQPGIDEESFHALGKSLIILSSTDEITTGDSSFACSATLLSLALLNRPDIQANLIQAEYLNPDKFVPLLESQIEHLPQTASHTRAYLTTLTSKVWSATPSREAWQELFTQIDTCAAELVEYVQVAHLFSAIPTLLSYKQEPDFKNTPVAYFISPSTQLKLVEKACLGATNFAKSGDIKDLDILIHQITGDHFNGTIRRNLQDKLSPSFTTTLESFSSSLLESISPQNLEDIAYSHPQLFIDLLKVHIGVFNISSVDHKSKTVTYAKTLLQVAIDQARNRSGDNHDKALVAPVVENSLYLFINTNIPHLSPLTNSFSTNYDQGFMEDYIKLQASTNLVLSGISLLVEHKDRSSYPYLLPPNWGTEPTPPNWNPQPATIIQLAPDLINPYLNPQVKEYLAIAQNELKSKITQTIRTWLSIFELQLGKSPNHEVQKILLARIENLMPSLKSEIDSVRDNLDSPNFDSLKQTLIFELNK